jgi:hypothetical protein
LGKVFIILTTVSTPRIVAIPTVPRHEHQSSHHLSVLTTASTPPIVKAIPTVLRRRDFEGQSGHYVMSCQESLLAGEPAVQNFDFSGHGILAISSVEVPIQ